MTCSLGIRSVDVGAAHHGYHELAVHEVIVLRNEVAASHHVEELDPGLIAAILDLEDFWGNGEMVAH